MGHARCAETKERVFATVRSWFVRNTHGGFFDLAVLYETKAILFCINGKKIQKLRGRALTRVAIDLNIYRHWWEVSYLMDWHLRGRIKRVVSGRSF